LFKPCPGRHQRLVFCSEFTVALVKGVDSKERIWKREPLPRAKRSDLRCGLSKPAAVDQ